MRLIDAEQFGVISLQGKSEDFIEGVAFMFDKIHEAPTVEERPHGEWVDVAKDDDGFTIWYKCSMCNHRVTWHLFKTYHFCPNCGAKMKEDEQE